METISRSKALRTSFWFTRQGGWFGCTTTMTSLVFLMRLERHVYCSWVTTPGIICWLDHLKFLVFEMICCLGSRWNTAVLPLKLILQSSKCRLFLHFYCIFHHFPMENTTSLRGFGPWRWGDRTTTLWTARRPRAMRSSTCWRAVVSPSRVAGDVVGSKKSWCTKPWYPRCSN